MRRISLSLALVVTCLLVLAACGGKSKSSSASSNSGSGIAGAEIAPASATSFASINTDSSSAQWKQVMALMAKVPALQSSVNDSLSSSGITLADVESALGPTTDVVELGTSATPTEVFFTNPKDPATLKSLLAKDKSQKSVTDEINGWVMVAKSQAALAEFKTAVASGKLSDDSAFKTATKGLPADALVKAYLKGSAINSSALSSLSSSSASKTLEKAMSKSPVDWMTLAASAVPKGLSIDGVVKSKTNASNSSLSLVDALPSGASFAVDFNGASLGLDKGVKNLLSSSKNASQVAQVEAALGIKSSDLVSLAGSEMSVYATGSGIGILIKAADATATTAMLDKAVTLLSSQLNGSSKATTVGGVQATELTFGTTTLYYGVKDGNLFIVTDASALPGNAKLSSDPGYKAAAAELSIPSSNLGVAYIDFAKLAALSKSGSSVIKSLGSSSGVNANMSNLEGLSSLLGYATANGDKIEFKGLLSTTG
jgi:hypothetical protein